VKTSYFRFAMNQSLANSDYFRALTLSAATLDELSALSRNSLVEQQRIEASDTLDFAAYLNEVNKR
jgi:gamma-glutamylcysteine synthetase